MAEPASGIYHLEDYEVGRVWTWGSYRVQRDEIIDFASRYDPQPFHLDEAAATASVFGGLTAPGVMSVAIENKMFHLDDGPRFRALALIELSEIAFPIPVRVGDTLSISFECVSVRASSSKPDRGVAVTRSQLLNQHGDVCLALTRTVLVPRQSPPDHADG